MFRSVDSEDYIVFRDDERGDVTGLGRLRTNLDGWSRRRFIWAFSFPA